MIRVCLLALMALLALVLVAKNLPGRAPEETTLVAQNDENGSDFARYEGVWKGSFNIHLPDGELDSTVVVEQTYTTVSSTEQSVLITDRHTDGRVEVSRGRNVERDGSLTCEVWSEDGALKKVFTGHRSGRAIFWHRVDAAHAIEETFREEIIRTPEGDLYTIDGAGTYGGAGGKMLIYSGRYRRVDQD